MTSTTRKTNTPRRSGNPFIDKLPKLMSKDNFDKQFRQVPAYDKDQRTASTEARIGFLLDPLLYICPLTCHYELYLAIWQMIQHGYATRDPRHLEYWRRWRVKMLALKEDLSKWELPQLARRQKQPFVASPFDASIFGLSGLGKSTSEGRIVRMFPQVVEHPKFNIRQLVWFEMETSTQSSTKDMLITAMASVDDALGTNYALHFGKGEEYQLLAHVINICFVNAVGLIVSDELQNLTNLKSRGAAAILGFLLRLANVSKTPMIALGTYEAETMMKTLRMKRRWWRAGIPEWLPLDRNTEYKVFLSGLWPLQYTRQVTKRSDELDDRLYEESQGIPDYIVRLYVLAQRHLIARNDRGKKPEIITPALITQVAHTYLGPATAVLKALRERGTGDTELLKSLPDVELPPISQVLNEKRIAATAAETPKQEPAKVAKGAPPNDQDCEKHKKNRSKGGKSRSTAALASELLSTVGDGVDKPKVAYDRLKGAGFIKSAVEFWD